MQQRLITYILFALILGTGCKLNQSIQMPAIKNMPDSFLQDKDSNSIADINWRRFFSDPQLIALIDTALLNNPDLYIAMQRIEIAKAKVAMSKGALLPALNAVAAGGIEKYGDYTLNGVGNFDTNLSPNIDKKQRIPTDPTPDLFLGFRSTWEIDVWGKLKNQKKAAIARLLATEKGRQSLVTALVAETANLYYSLLALDNALKTVKKNILLQEAALEIVKVQKEGGRATELAVQQFSAQLLNTKAIEYGIRQQIVFTENQLNMLAGRYPQHIGRDTSIIRQQIPKLLQTGLPSAVITRRPDIRQAELELLAAKADLGAARAAFLPSFTLNPYLALNAFKPSLLFNAGSVTYGLLGSIAAPVFNQNQIKAGYAIAASQQKEVFYNYQKALLNGFGEVVTNLNSIDNNRQSYLLKEQEVAELTRAVSTAKDLYLTGYASYLEVITAQKGVLEAELELASNKKELFQSVINLYRSLGGGWN